MSKDTSGGVEQAGTAPGTVVQKNDAGLVDAGPCPYPEAGRPAAAQVSRVRARRHRGPGRRSAPRGGSEARPGWGPP